LVESHNSFIPPAFDIAVRGSPLVYCDNVWYGKTRMVWLPDTNKFIDTLNDFNTIPACDRQADGQTFCDSIIHAMHIITW